MKSFYISVEGYSVNDYLNKIIYMTSLEECKQRHTDVCEAVFKREKQRKFTVWNRDNKLFALPGMFLPIYTLIFIYFVYSSLKSSSSIKL